MRKEFKELYSATEEAKADVSGLFALQFLVDRGKLDAALGETMYTTYLASMFRSIRFGINEAHGRGVAVQLNYFLDHGGVTVGAGRHASRWTPAKIKQNVTDLTRDLMTHAGDRRLRRRPRRWSRSWRSSARRCRRCSTG